MHITRHDDGRSLSLSFSLFDEHSPLFRPTPFSAEPRWIYQSQHANEAESCQRHIISLAFAIWVRCRDAQQAVCVCVCCCAQTEYRVDSVRQSTTSIFSRRRASTLCFSVVWCDIIATAISCRSYGVRERYMFGLAWAWLGKHELNYTSTMFVYISHCSLSCSMRPSCEQNMRRGSWFREYIYGFLLFP